MAIRSLIAFLIVLISWTSAFALTMEPPKKPDPPPKVPTIEELIEFGKCEEKPEAGPCKAAIPRYFYNIATKRCRVFMWGGCEGNVPFETLEECEAACGSRPDANEVFK